MVECWWKVLELWWSHRLSTLTRPTHEVLDNAQGDKGHHLGEECHSLKVAGSERVRELKTQVKQNQPERLDDEGKGDGGEQNLVWEHAWRMNCLRW